jgi:hypothetical protein
MSDQNLPDQNKSNQNMNAQPETASDQLAPDGATFDNLVVTKSVRIGVPNTGTSEPQNRLYVVAPGGFPNNVPIVAQSVSTFFGARDSDGRERFAINLDKDGTSYPVDFYDRYDGTWRRSISLKLGNVGIGTNNPRSMLHIGDGLPTPPIGGYRPWMLRGTQVSWDSDNVFFGLKDEGENRKDAVIAWGDDASSDVFRFIFTANGGPDNGQEIMRLQPNGNLGIGTPNPEGILHLNSARGNIKMLATSGGGADFNYDGGADSLFWFTHYGKDTGDTRFLWSDGTKTTDLLTLQNKGNVGIGTPAPSEKLEVVGNLKCVKLLETSSRESKENIAELSGKEAVEALKNLNPVKFNFKADSDKNLHLGFIAEDVPELVATSDRKTLSPMDIVAVLTQALKEQQNTISALAEKVKLLEAKTA